MCRIASFFLAVSLAVSLPAVARAQHDSTQPQELFERRLYSIEQLKYFAVDFSALSPEDRIDLLSCRRVLFVVLIGFAISFVFKDTSPVGRRAESL
jgi:hypothetical protein